MVASGALLLATDALSSQRTVGSYMLSACDPTKSQLAEFDRHQGSADSLLAFATTYDPSAARLMKQRVFDTAIQRNVTDLKRTIRRTDFAEMCRNLTQDERTQLTVDWGNITETYILIIDEIRENYVIPFILQVYARHCDS